MPCSVVNGTTATIVTRYISAKTQKTEDALPGWRETRRSAAITSNRPAISHGDCQWVGPPVEHRENLAQRIE